MINIFHLLLDLVPGEVLALYPRPRGTLLPLLHRESRE
jgi:hypothetical protein